LKPQDFTRQTGGRAACQDEIVTAVSVGVSSLAQKYSMSTSLENILADLTAANNNIDGRCEMSEGSLPCQANGH
jgi:hypothetical protein